MSQIRPGERVKVRTAFGDYLEKVALSGVEMGHSFQVVWVCSPEEKVLAESEGRAPEGTPWPAAEVLEMADA